MKKFKITEVQIDNFNDTNNSFQKFDEGINVVCGYNEAGKSTLMEFIKSIFIRKSTNAKGYVKCEYDGKTFSLIPGNTKKLKENEQFINGVTSHDFQTGFVINIDDINFASKAKSEELLNTIKDSSGNAVNKKQEEYEKFIHDNKKQKFSLKQSNDATNSFKDQFNKLNNLNNEINNLMAKEDEYNNVCAMLESANIDFNNIKIKSECAEKIFQKIKLISEKDGININPKLMEFISDFDNIRLDYGALKSFKERKNDLLQKIENNNNEFEEKFKELNKVQSFDYNELDEFDLSKDVLNFGRNISEKEKELNSKKKIILDKIVNLKKSIDEENYNIKSTNNILTDMGIDNIKTYKDDRDLLESYYERYSDILNKMMKNDNKNTKRTKWYNDMFLITFLSMFFAILGTLIMFWNTGIRLPMVALLLVSIAGINTVIMQKIEAKRDSAQNDYSTVLKKDAMGIIKICKKYNYNIEQDDNFIVKISAFIKKMSNNISEYEIVEKDLLGHRINLEKLKTELQNFEEEENNIDKDIEICTKEKMEFLDKNNIKNLENLEEIFEYIKVLKTLKNEALEQEKLIEKYEEELEKFTQKLNKFIVDCELENLKTYNKYDYDEFEGVMKIIETLVYENNSSERILNDINSKLEKLQLEINNYSDEIVEELKNIDEEKLEELKNTFQEKTEYRARLSQQKDDLEKVSGLFKLKNEKNIELNNIKFALSKLIQKEIIYNIIENAKEKFNETQPNLVRAKEYFKQITNNKYSEVDFESKTISGENVGDKDWDILSRGTREQLYLALRLGYADNYSKDIDGNSNGLPDLPIIIDDAFVNFDRERTSAIMRCLKEVSKTNQVLYFTCHTDNIKEILKKEKIKYNYIELK